MFDRNRKSSGSSTPTSPAQNSTKPDIHSFKRTPPRDGSSVVHKGSKEHLASVAEEPVSEVSTTTPETSLDVSTNKQLIEQQQEAPVEDAESTPTSSIPVVEPKPALSINQEDNQEEKSTTADNAPSQLGFQSVPPGVSSGTAAGEPWKKVITERSDAYQDMSDDDEVEEVPIDRSPGKFLCKERIPTTSYYH